MTPPEVTLKPSLPEAVETTITELWKAVFGREPALEWMDNQYSENDEDFGKALLIAKRWELYPVVLEPKVGALVTINKRCGYEIGVTIQYGGGYWDPPDADYKELSRHETFGGVLCELVVLEAREYAENHLNAERDKDDHAVDKLREQLGKDNAPY